MNVDELKASGKKYIDEKNFSESVKIFHQLYNSTKDKWDGSHLAKSYNGLKEYDKAEKISQEVFEANPNFSYIKGEYARSLCMNKMSKKSPNYSSSTLEKNFEIIFNCEEADKRYWTSIAFKYLLEGLKQNNQNDKIAKWYDKIDIDLLNSESKKSGKVEFNSDRDVCFLIFIRAFLAMQQWSKCVEVCDFALKNAQSDIFSSNKNAFWYKRGKAIALMHQGQYSTSIGIFEDLLNQKQDWFLYKEIAEVYKLQGDRSLEKDYLIAGCLSSSRQPKIGMMWGMFFSLGLNLLETDNPEFGKLHLQLSLKAREVEGWSESKELYEAMKKYEVETQFSKDGRRLIKELTPYWNDNKPNPYKNNKRYNGTIIKILPNGLSGFIKSNSTDDSYFFSSRDINFSSAKIVQGLEVNFCLTTRYDNKQKKYNNCAVDISLV